MINWSPLLYSNDYGSVSPGFKRRAIIPRRALSSNAYEISQTFASEIGGTYGPPFPPQQSQTNHRDAEWGRSLTPKNNVLFNCDGDMVLIEQWRCSFWLLQKSCWFREYVNGHVMCSFMVMDLLNNVEFRFDSGACYALYSNLLKFCCDITQTTCWNSIVILFEQLVEILL